MECVDCMDVATFYCAGCDVYFCSNHSIPHIKKMICRICKKEKCFIYFEIGKDDPWSLNECFKCNVSKLCKSVEKNKKRLKFIEYLKSARDAGYFGS